MARETYSAVGDLLIGDLRLSAALDRQKIIEDAADEIDSIIGQRFQIPFALEDLENPASRLTIKRVNNWLATGRLIIAAAAASEDNSLHAYGMRLINDALRALASLDFEGLVPLDESGLEGPTIHNQDATSGVDAFYGTFATGKMWTPGRTA